MSFTNQSEVLLYLNKTSGTALELAQIDSVIASVDDIIQDYCGWKVLATDYVDEPFVGDGTNTLSLKVWPISSLTKVTLDGEDITTGVTFNAKDGTLKYVDGTFTDQADVLVTFNAGYGTVANPIPKSLEFAASFQVVSIVKPIMQEWIGVEEGKFQNTEVKLASTDLPVVVTRTLDRYRLVRVF